MVFTHEAVREWEAKLTPLLSEHHDQAAAEAFFRSARTVTDSIPERVTSDGHGSYPGAIKAELVESVTCRINRYLNNHLEQDHRGIKQRTHPMCGFTSFVSAAQVCRVYDELRHFFRVRSQRNESVSLAWQWALHSCRIGTDGVRLVVFFNARSLPA
jgi:transposase-like protein